MTEGTGALVALVGVFYLVRGSSSLRHALQNEIEKSDQLQSEAEKWRSTANKYIEGVGCYYDNGI